jgi:Cytochrome P460
VTRAPSFGNTTMQSRLSAGLLVCAAVLLPLQPIALAQGSGSSRSTAPRATRPPTPDEFSEKFWQFLHSRDAPYTRWSVAPSRNGFRDGRPPHGDFVKIYANKTAADRSAALPYGAVLVAENFDKDQRTLSSIDVMYRVEGADPQHYDWHWMRYLPNGSLARTPAQEGNRPMAGKVTSCIDCHGQAGGRDWVFSNDPAGSR